MNEYNTIEYSGDKVASPTNYYKKISEILQSEEATEMSFAIGLQGHFASGQPNLAYMRSGLDFLGEIGFPIWLTETSVDPQPEQVYIYFGHNYFLFSPFNYKIVVSFLSI
jgi:GH35 family endo-1,4-beta-xylanase